MGLLIAEGFEHIHGNVDVTRRFPETVSGVPTSLAFQSGRLPGGRCLRAQNGENFIFRSAALSPSGLTAILGFAFRTNGTASSALSLTLLNSSNAAQLKIETTNIGGLQQLYLKRGATTLYTSIDFPIAEYLFIELKALIDPTIGTWELRINEMTVASGSGNTANAGTSGFSKLLVNLSADAGVGNWVDLDDLYLFDTSGDSMNDLAGALGIECLHGIRLVTENAHPWVPNTGTNKAAIDDGNTGVVDDDATYVTNDPLTDVLDLYGMSHPRSIRSSALNIRLSQDVKNTAGAATFYPAYHLRTRTVEPAISVGAAAPYARYAADIDPMTSEDLADASFGFADTAPASIEPIPLP